MHFVRVSRRALTAHRRSRPGTAPDQLNVSGADQVVRSESPHAGSVGRYGILAALPPKREIDDL
jgi:hypothetical protein